MLVYRAIIPEEFYKGNYRPENVIRGWNNHLYDNISDYVHFFKYSQQAEMFAMDRPGPYNKKVLIMVLDIPDNILEYYFGFGSYSTEYGACPIPEYAIPRKEIDMNWYVFIGEKVPSCLEYNKKDYFEYVYTIKSLRKNNSLEDIYLYAIEEGEENILKLSRQKIDYNTFKVS